MCRETLMKSRHSMSSTTRRAIPRVLWPAAPFLLMMAGCPFQFDQPAPDNPTEPSAVPPEVVWSIAFEATGVGALSAVWGNSPNDVFVVGGTPGQGEVYHFDGSTWAAMPLPQVPLLVWVFGFGPNDVTAVGVGGGVIHYDGISWTALDSGTTDDLWGIWGPAPDDVWIVGGTVGQGDPVILHFDGATFTPVAMPPNDRGATSLFKVWGIGSKIFAVGQNGVIIQYEGAQWFQVLAGSQANEDFVALWGTSEENIVAVGGRATARLAVYDGEQWTTYKHEGIPGLNAVCTEDPREVVVGGVNGYVGRYDPQTNTLIAEMAPTEIPVHGAWADGTGRSYGVAGQFAAPYTGVAMIRTLGDPGITPVAPLGVISTCEGNGDCPAGRHCVDGNCVSPPGCAGGDNDGDGWLNSCDNCTEVFNEIQSDADADGIGDACDACPDSDDNIDIDDDGVPDGCDLCPGGDDALDADGDGSPDACDICPGFEDDTDQDGDGVPDGCDLCPGGDDALDADGDGSPDACDLCPGFVDGVDGDGDGTPNGCDICTGFDDRVDSDGDGVPDGCDPCPLDNPDDTDMDGVCDSADACPGMNDNDIRDCNSNGTADVFEICSGALLDCDGNGVPDQCECCGGDTDGDRRITGLDIANFVTALTNPPLCDTGVHCSTDVDHNGVLELADVPLFVDLILNATDSDGDGASDHCDRCAGEDDFADADNDGTPDACDVCPGYDDSIDADGDGVPNACDVCGGNDVPDTDGDGVPDACDLCADFDDAIDSDADGLPDDCDPCPLDDPDDSDGDGVCDSSDICPGGDDTRDGDGDAVPDSCDICPGFDDALDGDGDGVADGCDACPGFDDLQDDDGNGVPDGCCGVETDCLLGESCDGPYCVPAAGPDMILGYGSPFVPVVEGGDFPVWRGFQGPFTDTWASYRATGFAPNALVNVTVGIVLDSGLVVLPETTYPRMFTEIEPGINQILLHYLFLPVDTSLLDDQEADISVTIRDAGDPAIEASAINRVILREQ